MTTNGNTVTMDFELENHGSLWLVRPLTDEAMEWLTKHTDGMWWGKALAVEHRFVADLVDGIHGEGFTVMGPS